MTEAAALMPLAVTAICRGGERLGLSDEEVRRLVSILTRASGAAGMVGGQLLDLRAEGRRIPRAELERIHAGKTAAIFAAAAEMGGVAARASESLLARLRRFGFRSGIVFQAVDDILDATGSTEELGKESGRDATLGKATYPVLFGFDEAERIRTELAETARRALEGIQDSGELGDLLELVVDRRS